MEKEIIVSYILILISVFLFTMSMSLVAPLLPTYKAVFNCSSFTYGMMMASYSLSNFFSLLISGVISDKYGRRIILYISLVGSGLGALFTGLSRSALMFIISRFVSGFFAGVILVCKAYVADITLPTERSKYLAISTGALAAGSMLGPTLGSFLGTISIYTPFYVNTGACFIVFIFCVFFLKDSTVIKNRLFNSPTAMKTEQIHQNLLSSIEEEGPIDIPLIGQGSPNSYEKTESIPNLTGQLSALSSSKDANHSARRSSFSSFLETSDLLFTPQNEIVDDAVIPKSTDIVTIILICTSIFITWSSFSCFYSIFNLWLSETFKTSSMLLGLMFTLSSGVIVLTTLFIYPFLIRFLYNSTILIIGSSILCICWTLIVILQKELPSYILAITSTIGTSLANSVPHILMSLCSSPDKQGLNLSFSLSSDSLSRTVFPLLYGFVYDYSKVTPFWICAGCALLNIPVAFYLKTRVKKREDELDRSTKLLKQRILDESLRPSAQPTQPTS